MESTLTAASGRPDATQADGQPSQVAHGFAYAFAAVTPQRVHQARRAVSAYCLANQTTKDSSTDAADNVALVVGELLANAGRHAPGPAELIVTSEPGCWILLVNDTSSQPPVPDLTEPGTKTSGLGLHMIEQLADEWGWYPTTTGKATWARCPKTAA